MFKCALLVQRPRHKVIKQSRRELMGGNAELVVAKKLIYLFFLAVSRRLDSVTSLLDGSWLH